MRSEVEALRGVTHVRVDLATGRLEVTGRQAVLPAEIEEAVTEAGYELDQAV